MRYIGIVTEVKDLKHNKYEYREGEAKSDCLCYTKEIIISNIREYGNSTIIYPSITCCFSKRLLQEGVKIFIGNKIAFDATVSDETLKYIRNICGKEIEFYNQMKDFNLKSGVVPTMPTNCLFCKYRNSKTSCDKNKIPSV